MERYPSYSSVNPCAGITVTPQTLLRDLVKTGTPRGSARQRVGVVRVGDAEKTDFEWFEPGCADVASANRATTALLVSPRSGCEPRLRLCVRMATLEYTPPRRVCKRERRERVNVYPFVVNAEPITVFGGRSASGHRHPVRKISHPGTRTRREGQNVPSPISIRSPFFIRNLNRCFRKSTSGLKRLLASTADSGKRPRVTLLLKRPW